MGLLIYADSSGSGEAYDEPWLIIGALVLYIPLARASLLWIRRGWKYEALPADALLATDARAPVLYLRSFIDDDPTGGRSPGVRAWRHLRWHTHLVSIEQELARVLSRVGPVVAIGRPGDSVPELGAARLYARDDEWQAKVSELMLRARLVVIRAGPTPGLQWEIEEASRLLRPDQVVVVSAPQRPPREPLRLDVFLRQFGLTRALVPPAKPIGQIVPSVRWQTFWLAVWRPYLECVESAFRQVFDHLGLPWIEQKSRATTGLLALFGGMFGLHHFYLGNRRRGLWYLAFFWTGIPVVLGWIDLVRLVLAAPATT